MNLVRNSVDEPVAEMPSQNAPAPPVLTTPDEDVLSMRAAAEAHRMVKLCH